MNEECTPRPAFSRENILALTRDLFGVEDTDGIELFALLHRVAHTSEQVEMQFVTEQNVSGPRWRLLLRLLVEEHLGNTAGLNPTAISKAQRVSKNTISVLLRGLEEQGLVQRSADPGDLRGFRIQLTGEGRALLHATAPLHLQHLNHLLRTFKKEEIRQFIALLDRLQAALAAHMQDPNPQEARSAETAGTR